MYNGYMSCFNTVIVPCPKCGKPEYCQSKSGECLLKNYTIKNAPLAVLTDINRHAPFTCRYCGHVWEVSGEMIEAVRGPHPVEGPGLEDALRDAWQRGYNAALTSLGKDRVDFNNTPPPPECDQYLPGGDGYGSEP